MINIGIFFIEWRQEIWNTSISWDILKEIKDESEIEAKAASLSSFQMWIQVIEWEDRDILLIKNFEVRLNWASGILTIFLISEDIEPWYSYRQYSYKKKRCSAPPPSRVVYNMCMFHCVNQMISALSKQGVSKSSFFAPTHRGMVL